MSGPLSPSRRDFLKGSGALVVAFGAGGITVLRSAESAQPVPGWPGDDLDSWIAVTEDGRVLAWTGKCELGQGLFTAQTQLIAEELVVPLDRVTLVQCDTDRTPDQGTTSGAQSHHANFNRSNLALAAATAREALVRLAAERLGAPIGALEVKDGVVRVARDAARSVSYGALVGGRRLDIKLDEKAARRSPREWTVLGRPVPRLELPAMATGRFEYVHNVRLPGMLHGQVVRPPVVGATLVSVDQASVKDAPGVVKVVVKKNFVGVVAEKPWQALRAAEMLKVDVRTPGYLGRLTRWARANPTRVEGLYVSPLAPDAANYLVAAVTAAAKRYPVDGVFLDAVRFPGVDFDYSRHAMEIFRADTRPQLSVEERARLDEVEAIDPFGYAEEFPERWRAFRQSRLTTLVSRLRRALSEINQTLVVSAGVPSDPSSALAESFQDWTNWMQTGLVDGVGRRSGTSGTIVFSPDAFSAAPR